MEENVIQNIEDLRLAQAQMNMTAPCNEKWEFFYDETGNCRKFFLKEDGSFNNQEALNYYFILGGLVFESKEDVKKCDVSSLIKSLHLQKTVTELKSHHLNRRKNLSFKDFIKQDRVTKVIQWIYNSKANIHFCVENILYYALVDIVDSLNKPEMGVFLFDLKAIFYRIVKKYIDNFADFFSRYGYPDVTQTEFFWNELSALLDEVCYNDPELKESPSANILSTMVRDNARHVMQQENTLITGNEKNELQDSFAPLYLGRCQTFLYAHHNFDEEIQVIPQMSTFPIKNFRFVNSVNEPLIQVSDCFISILSKILFFLDSKTIEEIENYSQEMDNVSKRNLVAMNYLILRSNAEHSFLTQYINAQSIIRDQEQKWQILTN